jgi:hypothetical protein
MASLEFLGRFVYFIMAHRAVRTLYVSFCLVNGGLHMYLIDRMAVAYLGEICALDDESGSGGSAD